MSAGGSKPGLSASDYESIEAAVMETERGRWFLAEYAKRQRAADTGMLLEALKKLEAAIVPLKPQPAAERPADLFAQDEHLFASESDSELPAPDEPVALKLETPPLPERKRVVIIRRSSSENVDIPLADASAG